jgi:hypothetical protein
MNGVLSDRPCRDISDRPCRENVARYYLMHVVFLHARDAHFPAIIRMSRVYNPFLVVSFLFLQRRNNIYTVRFYRGCNHKDT